MLHDPARIEDTQAWLRKAGVDRESPRIQREHGSARAGNGVSYCRCGAERAFTTVSAARETCEAVVARLPEEVRP